MRRLHGPRRRKPVRAWVTTVSAAVGKRITTIEGLGSREAPHPWREHTVLAIAAGLERQCGGFVAPPVSG